MNRRLLAIVIPALLLPAGGWCCSNVYGIPGQGRMETWTVDLDGRRQMVSAFELDRSRWYVAHAYRLAPGGAANSINEEHAYEVHSGGRRYRLPLTGRAWPGHDFEWAPDGRRAAYLERGVDGVVRVRSFEVRKLGDPAAVETAWDPTAGATPAQVAAIASSRQVTGFAWGRADPSLFVVERFYTGSEASSRIVRCPPTSAPEDVLLVRGAIEPFAPLAGAESQLLYGTHDGLFVSDARGGVRTMPLPGVGIGNLDCSPVAPDALVFYRRAAVDSRGKEFRGVWLLQFERGQAVTEQLHAGMDVHSVWWSPRGTWVSWATASSVHYREADARNKPSTELSVYGVKGFAWDDEERRLAIVTGEHLLVHDRIAGTTVKVCSFETAGQTAFLADPSWIGDQVYLSHYVEAAGAVEPSPPGGRNLGPDVGPGRRARNR